MATIPKLTWFAIAALLAGACGDGTGPAVERNKPGTGTNTLRVVADIEAQDVPGGFVTVFDVELRNTAGDPVSGATVTVKNGTLGTVNLLETGAATGDYRATVNSFPSGDFQLNVIRGTDKVEGVVVGGLAAHKITAPAKNATVPANQPLTVTWDRPTEAAGADLETRDYSANGLPDTGSHIIPGTKNPPRADQRIRLWRYNQVSMAGGLAGSRLKLEVRNTVEPVVVQ